MQIFPTTPLLHIHSLIGTALDGEEDGDIEEEVKLSPADVKKYEAQFSGSVFQYNSLEMKEIIGEGLNIFYHIDHLPFFYLPPSIINIVHFSAGGFGRVYFGILNDPEKEMRDVQVAIKTIKSKHDIVYMISFSS